MREFRQTELDGSVKDYLCGEEEDERKGRADDQMVEAGKR